MNANSKTILAIASVLATTALMSPVFARDGDDPGTSFNESTIFSHLHSRGIPAIELGTWGDKIRATVLNSDGSTEFRFYDEATLAPYTPGAGGNKRVLPDRGVRIHLRQRSLLED